MAENIIKNKEVNEKNKTLGVAVTGLSIFTIGFGLGAYHCVKNCIPHSYRQTPLNCIDYTFGKNVFHRTDSLM